MKFIIDHIELRQALKRIAPAVNLKSIMPVLENVHIQLASSVATLTTTDLHIYMQTTCEITNSVDGVLLLPFVELSKIANVVAGPISISAEKTKIKIESGDDRFSFTKPDDEKTFPSLPNFKTLGSFKLENDCIDVFAKMSAITKLDKTGIDTRFEHIAIRMVEGKFIVVYATDSMRAVKYITSIQSPTSHELPLHKNQCRLLKEIGPCELSFGEKWVKVDGLNVSATMILPDFNGSKYPDVEMIFTKHSTFNVGADRGDLLAAIDKVQVFNTEHPIIDMMFGMDHGIDIDFNDNTGKMLSSKIKAQQEMEPMQLRFAAKLFPELISCLPHGERLGLSVGMGGQIMYMGIDGSTEITGCIMPIVKMN